MWRQQWYPHMCLNDNENSVVCGSASQLMDCNKDEFLPWLIVYHGALGYLYIYLIKCLDTLMFLSSAERIAAVVLAIFVILWFCQLPHWWLMMVVFIWMIQLLVGTGEEHQTLALLNMASRSCSACCLLYS